MSLLASLRPKLIEIAVTPGQFRAVLTAVVIKSVSDGRVGLDQDDVGLRGDGMGPFHVQRRFHRPAGRTRRRRHSWCRRSGRASESWADRAG